MTEPKRTIENPIPGIDPELLLLRRLAVAVKKLRMTPVVDDDFPEMLHNVDMALSVYESTFTDPRDTAY